MDLMIHPKVADELAEAASWHHGIDPDLAERFLMDAYETIRRAAEMPTRFRVIEKPYRRVLCETFPYQVVFEILADPPTVHIVSVIHQMRHPDLWKKDLT
jgi:plasmid stabilization system protein ParE